MIAVIPFDCELGKHWLSDNRNAATINGVLFRRSDEHARFETKPLPDGEAAMMAFIRKAGAVELVPA